MREPRLAHSLSAKVASTVPVSDNDEDVEMQGQSVLARRYNSVSYWLHALTGACILAAIAGDVDNGLIAECAKLVSKLKIQYKPNQLENPGVWLRGC